LLKSTFSVLHGVINLEGWYCLFSQLSRVQKHSKIQMSSLETSWLRTGFPYSFSPNQLGGSWTLGGSAKFRSWGKPNTKPAVWGYFVLPTNDGNIGYGHYVCFVIGFITSSYFSISLGDTIFWLVNYCSILLWLWYFTSNINISQCESERIMSLGSERCPFPFNGGSPSHHGVQ
jgi:hypothetical protein